MEVAFPGVQHPVGCDPQMESGDLGSSSLGLRSGRKSGRVQKLGVCPCSPPHSNPWALPLGASSPPGTPTGGPGSRPLIRLKGPPRPFCLGNPKAGRVPGSVLFVPTLVMEMIHLPFGYVHGIPEAPYLQ